MKLPIILSLILLPTLSSLAQTKGGQNLYLESLEAHLEYVTRLYGSNKVSTLYIAEHFGITDQLPGEIMGYQIKYLNAKEISDKARDNGFYLITLRPMTLQEESLTVHIVDQTVNPLKKRNVEYVISGGSILNYKYDCKTQRYVLSSKEQSGI